MKNSTIDKLIIAFDVGEIFVNQPAPISFGFGCRFETAFFVARDFVLRVETFEHEFARRDEFCFVASFEKRAA